VLNGDLHSGHTRYNQKFPSLLPYGSEESRIPPKKSRNAGTGKKKNMAISDWNILELASINLWRWSFHVPTFLVTSNP